MSIEIFYEEKSIGKWSGHAVLESCECPKPTWIDHCKKEIPQQIQTDLAQFESIDWKLLRPQLLKKFNNPESTSFCNYVVQSNQIYRKCYGKFTGFSMFMDAILLSLARIWVLPDLDFFINLGDWPLIQKREELLPMFSWCGSNKTNDIVLPTYDITESTLENLGRVALDMLSVQRAKIPWEKKAPVAFWRGRDSRRERLDLIDIAHQHPELFNVSLTNFFFFRNEEHKYGPKTPHLSFHDFFDYKYQLNLDGTVAAYRLPYLLAGDAVVFKQDSPYYEHYYRELEPFVHYIPFKRDLSDLVEKVRWAQENDETVRQIAKQARAFAEEHLMPMDILCYHAKAFQEYARKLTNVVEVQDDMERVEQTSRCRCEGHDEL